LAKIANEPNVCHTVGMPTRNVNLTKELDEAVQKRVASGEYENASEVVRAALRALAHAEREEQAKLEWLRKALKAGEASPIAEDFSFDKVRAKIRARARARK
jgi:antitoxin ParD1/3/4